MAEEQSPVRYTFDQADNILIEGKSWKLAYRNSEGCVLQPQSPGVPQFFSNSDLHRMVKKSLLEVKKEQLLAFSSDENDPGSYPEHLWMDDDVEERLRYKESIVLAVNELRARKTFRGQRIKLHLTEESIAEHEHAIKAVATEYYRKHAPEKKERTEAGPVKFSPSSVKRWRAQYKRGGRIALKDKYCNCGQGTTYFLPPVAEILKKTARGYLSREKPTKKNIYDDLVENITELNERRAIEGLPPFKTPSRNALSRVIDNFGPFLIKLYREGEDAVKRDLRQTGQGITASLLQPLQRVLMDEMQIDVIAFLRETDLLDLFDEEAKKRLGLAGKKGRWWLTVAMCATTRVILGMRLSASPSRYSAAECIEMCLNDKGAYSDAVGALTPWTQHGRIVHLVCDGGPAFKAGETRQLCADLGIRYEIAVNGVPELRAAMERLFGTMSVSLMPRLSGRTFSNPTARRDYDAVQKGVLTADELATILVRWAVDVYHNQPHDGLNFHTPLEAWDKAMADWGVAPAPSLQKQAQTFARPMRRVLQGDGITILGVRYHSPELGKFGMNRKSKMMDVRWFAGDLGAIWVKMDTWQRVPAVFEGFSGVRAREWVSAAQEMRASLRERQKVSQGIVIKALQAIKAIDAHARQRAGLFTEVWSPEAIARIEEELFMGFVVSEQPDTPDTLRTADGLGFEVLPEVPAEFLPDHEVTDDEAKLTGVDRNSAWNVKS